MKQVIVCLEDGNIIGYWDFIDRRIRTKSLSLIDEENIESEYEKVMIQIHVHYKGQIIFPVIVPFEINLDFISDELRQKSKIIYDKLTQEHWPIRS